MDAPPSAVPEVDRRGRFIVIEGIDGAGTTTQVARLGAALERLGRRVVTTFEPTSGPVGRLLRDVLSRKVTVADAEGVRGFSAATLSLLFAADRLDHLGALIEPALAEGKDVITDRYDLSSLAYQSATARGADLAPWIRELNRHARRPDLTVVLRVAPEEAERRRLLRGGAPELYEQRDLQRRLASFYDRAAELLPAGDRVEHLDAEGSEEEVTRALVDRVVRVLGLA